MSYTREQRAANAAKAAARAAAAAAESAQPAPESVEPASENAPNLNSGVALKRGNPDRDIAFNDIVARRDKASGLAPAEETETPEPKAQEAEPAQEPQNPEPQKADEAPQKAEEVKADAPAVEMVTVKVDGEEFQVPKSEVEEVGGVRAYQTIRAADNRLKKATETLAATRQTQAQIAEFARTALTPKQPEQPKKTKEELIQAIRFGSPDEADAALEEIAARGRGQPVDPEQIMNRTMTEMKKIAAAEHFMKEFSDIAANPIVMHAALAMDRQRMQEAFRNGQIGPQFDFAEHYRKIGNEIRSAFGRQSQPAAAPASAAPTASTPSGTSDKEARKASIVNLPSASARAELPAETKPDSREDTLNLMRKARGQPTV